MPAFDRRRARRALLIFAAAALARGVWLWAAAEASARVQGDETFFYESARNLIENDSFADDFGYRALRMPLYPGFLASVFLWTGPSPAAARAAQALLGAATCALIYLAAAAWLKEEYALFAGWTAACYHGLIFPCGRLLSESFYAFWLAALFAAWFWHRGRLKEPALMAVAGAALYLTRPEGVFAGLTLAALGPRLREGWRKSHSMVIVVGIALAMAAWGLRNRAVLGHFTPGTTGSGFSFWAALPRTLSKKLAVQEELPQPPSSWSELDRDRYFWRGGLAQLGQVPRWVVFKGAVYNLVGAFYPFLPGYDWSYGLILPFSLFGFWALRKRREARPLLVLLAAWSALYAVFGGQDARFRQLMAPLLILLAAGGLEDLGNRWRRPLFLRALAVWAALNAGVFFFAPQVRLAALAARNWLWGMR